MYYILGGWFLFFFPANTEKFLLIRSGSGILLVRRLSLSNPRPALLQKVLSVFVARVCVSVVMQLLSTCAEFPGPALPSSYNQDCVMAAHEDNSVPHVPGRAQESPQVHPDDEAVHVQQQRSAAVPHRLVVQQVRKSPTVWHSDLGKCAEVMSQRRLLSISFNLWIPSLWGIFLAPALPFLSMSNTLNVAGAWWRLGVCYSNTPRS